MTLSPSTVPSMSIRNARTIAGALNANHRKQGRMVFVRSARGAVEAWDWVGWTTPRLSEREFTVIIPAYKVTAEWVRDNVTA